MEFAILAAVVFVLFMVALVGREVTKQAVTLETRINEVAYKVDALDLNVDLSEERAQLKSIDQRLEALDAGLSGYITRNLEEQEKRREAMNRLGVSGREALRQRLMARIK